MLLASECQDGKYGIDCNNSCSPHCEDGPVCDRETGSCHSRQCHAGYQGSRCDQGEYTIIYIIGLFPAEITIVVGELFALITSAKEVMFLPGTVCLSVCLFVCLFVNKITQKLMDRF